MNIDQAITIVDTTLKQWKFHIEAKCIEGVVALYHPEKGLLFGTLDTMDTGLRNSPETMAHYYAHLLSNEVIKVYLPPLDPRRLQILSPTTIAYHGYYNFILVKNRTKKVHAKFTFIFELNPDSEEVYILSHCSGLTPQYIEERT